LPPTPVLATRPVELAKLLHLPAPTKQQAEIIAAPVEPMLVVAGAGSGKTETMAARVVWLVANSHVRPEQILGLTFTRKAAGELAHRIRQRLSALVRRLGRDDLLAGEPTVATYHSYAARVVREHGVRAGYEPATRLLTEAACWQLADSVVRTLRRRHDRRLVRTVHSASTRCCTWPATSPSTCARPTTWRPGPARFYGDVQAIPGTRIPAPVKKMLDRQRARLQLLPLVRRTRNARRRWRRWTSATSWPRGRPSRWRTRGRRGRAGPVPGGAAGRVPGHQPRPGRAAARAVRRRPPGDRRRRPVPVHLRLARRVGRHPRPVPERVPARRRRPAASCR
jgi:hypothetical protein